MRRLALLLLLMSPALSGTAGAQVPDQDAPGWQDLFDGKSLKGWTAKITDHAYGENFADTFRVEKGLLQVRYDGYDQFANRFGHLFFDTPYSHYVLHIEYRFVGAQAPGGPAGWAVRNSGVMLHAQDPETMSIDQDFPDSIEAQFLGGLSNGQARPTANLCTPGTHVTMDGKLFTPHCTPSTAATLDGDQWVDFMVIVLGHGRVRHFVNGEEVLRYEKPILDGGQHHDDPAYKLSSGYLALQSESHPIDFRQVRILNLAGCTNPAAKNFQPWAIKQSPGACEF